MRNFLVCLLVHVIGFASPAAKAEPVEASCTSRLKQTLAAIQERPLLKEEHATALMWLRMDAAEANAAGDEAGCIEKVAVAETLLGIAPAKD